MKPKQVHASSRFLFHALATILLGLLPRPAAAQTDSPVQSSARPFGLQIADTVKAAGSDVASANFQANSLASIRNVMNVPVGMRNALSDSRYLLDASKIQLATAYDVRAYFINEDAGYHNTLGFNAQGNGVGSGNPKLIFPDASTNVGASATSWNGVNRMPGEPLLPGDFVNLGNFSAGSKLDFFLIANGARSPQGTFTGTASANPDRINHVVAFTLADSPYLMLGFEDLMGGGDLDFNDLMVAIDIGQTNATALRAMAAAPAPALPLVLGCLFGVVVIFKPRRVEGTARGLAA